MERYGKIWKHMERYGKIWKDDDQLADLEVPDSRTKPDGQTNSIFIGQWQDPNVLMPFLNAPGEVPKVLLLYTQTARVSKMSPPW